IVKILEMYFALTKHQITVAWDGEEAYEQYIKGNFDLIITDYRMPKIDGLVLLRMIRQNDHKTPILLISADKNFESKDESSLSNYIIKKPFSFVDIGRVLSDVEKNIMETTTL